MKKRFLSFIAITMIIATSSQAQIITTVAGNGTVGFSGDGGQAILAGLDASSIAIDTFGNLYIADASNNRIRKVDITTGIISTYAGNGIAGYSGDGGVATAAKFNRPITLKFDKYGNLYIGDIDNHRIRKIDGKTGLISTVVGNGQSGFSGDGGLANNAVISGNIGMAFDASSNLYFADSWNSRVRKVDAKTAIITTVAGNGIQNYCGDGGVAPNTCLSAVYDIAIDSSNNLYITDYHNNRIRKVDSKTNIISTIAGTGISGYSGDGGLATSANIQNPEGLALDVLGNIYIGDRFNNIIRKVDVKTGIITTIAGGGSPSSGIGDGMNATSAILKGPLEMSFDKIGNLYIADEGNNRIRKITSSTLPISLSFFTATANNKAIGINWGSVTELNASHFIIQHSTDGCSFAEIGTVKALSSGVNNYEFTDNTPVIGINYYRLKSVDKDGNSTYSKVVSVNFGDKQSFSIIPNPAKDFTTISFSKSVNKATIAVYDITGKQIITQSLNENSNSYKLNTQSLKSGLYVIKINTTTGNYNEKLLINK